jgi:hypothetical protein
MRLKSAKKTLEELTSKYEEDPRNWRLSVGQDNRGFFDIFMANATNVWQVKLDSIYKPEPVGLGLKVGGSAEAKRIGGEEPSFGFRPISERMLENLLKRDGRDVGAIASDIMRFEPRPLDELRGSPVLSGPINWGGRHPLSERQAILDADLRANLRRHLHRKGFEQEFG